MDIPQSRFSGQRGALETAPVADPRLQPTPDYGTLGRGSDVGGSQPGSATGPVRQSANPRRFAPVFAAAIGVLAAVFAGSIGSSAHAAWSRFENLFSVREEASASAEDIRQLDHLKPQKQAEALLELAVENGEGAVDQISSRVDHWRGKVEWSPQIATLTTAALNSSDMRVRESGIEVELAAYGLAKNSASLDYLLRTAESSDHGRKIWALWALGLMGNRGVGTDRVVQVLTGYLKDTDEDSRRWAVEGLALAGTRETIAPLLQAMHDDSSASVRERAACSLAESGMFTQEQRLSAVPRLLSYTDDPSLDAQTRAWASQALSDITHQHFGNDSNAWRNWFNSTKPD
jgi:HEAT repeat protein